MDHTWGVGELSRTVDRVVRRHFADEVWVRGEVQNLKRHASGHTYFTLVEKGVRGDRPLARLDVALFRDDARTVTRRLKEVPGATDVVADRIVGKPYIEYELDRAEIARYGVNIRDVQDVIGAALNQMGNRLQGREVRVDVPAGLPLKLVHGHEFVFGFAAAIIFGVVLTALPSWAGTAEVDGGRLKLLVALWLAGRFGFWAAPWLPAPLPAPRPR